MSCGASKVEAQATKEQSGHSAELVHVRSFRLRQSVFAIATSFTWAIQSRAVSWRIRRIQMAVEITQVAAVLCANSMRGKSGST